MASIRRAALVGLVCLAGLLAHPATARAAWSIDLSNGSNLYYIGCVARAGLTSRIWACNADTGTWTQVNADCVMDEDIIIFGNSGNDSIVVGHGTDHTFLSTYTCGGESRNFGDITHSWGGNTWDIIIEGEEDNDTLWGDQSLNTFVLGGSGNDELRQFGSAGLEGDTNPDRVFSQNWSYDLEQMYGDTGSDCLEDADPAKTGEPEATVFDCGTTTGNDYVDCCDAPSPGQPDVACSHVVATCEAGGPAFAAGGGEGEGEGEEG